VSASSDESALRARMEREAAASPNSNWARAKIEIDAAKAAQLGKQFARNETWQCPTLVLKKMSAVAQHSTLTNEAQLRYIPRALRERWSTPSRNS
jgi:hypothetical protein